MVLVVTSLAAAVLSLLVSLWAAHLTQPIVLIAGFLKLQLSYNAGIAFGIDIPSPWQEILIVSALGAVCVFAIRSTLSLLSSIAFGLIIGGAVANVLDRIRDGLVTDYVAVGTFPIFNLADSCITVGAALLIFESFVSRKSRRACDKLGTTI